METLYPEKNPIVVPKKIKLLRTMHDYLFVTFGVLLYAVGWTIFQLPLQLTPGGVPGIASLIFYATGLPVEYSYFAINGSLLVISILILGWKFSMKTVYAFCIMMLVLPTVQALCSKYGIKIDIDPFAAAMMGGGCCGAGIGVAFSVGGSLGGTDIVAAVVNKYKPTLSLGRIGMYCDIIIVSVSYFVVAQGENVFYSFVVLVVACIMLDFVVNRSRQSVQYMIISKHYEEIGRRIINSPNRRGCTILHGEGFYTGNDVKVLFVLTRRSESQIIFRLIKDVDPHAFVSQSNVVGVYGNGFDNIVV